MRVLAAQPDDQILDLPYDMFDWDFEHQVGWHG
jgi:hypothetical protein